MLFKNATIYTMEQDPFVGDFKIDKGVFTEIGKDLNPKDVTTGGEMIYQLFMDLLSDDKDRANFYINELKKKIDS